MNSLESIQFKFYCRPYGVKLLSSDCSKIQERKFKRNVWVSNDIKNKRRDLCEGCSGPVPLPETDSEIIEESKQEGKTMPEERTCKTEGCNNLGTNPNGFCNECTSKRLREGRKKHAERARNKITVDLSDYPDLLGRIREQAHKEFRTVEMQALWFLLKGMEKGG